jgi:hypothetical protein
MLNQAPSAEPKKANALRFKSRHKPEDISVKKQIYAVVAATAAAVAMYNLSPRSFTDRYGVTTLDDQISAGCLRMDKQREPTSSGDSLIEAKLSPEEQEKLFEIEKSFLCGDRNNFAKERDLLLSAHGLQGKYWVHAAPGVTPHSMEDPDSAVYYEFTYSPLDQPKQQSQNK